MPMALQLRHESLLTVEETTTCHVLRSSAELLASALARTEPCRNDWPPAKSEAPAALGFCCDIGDAEDFVPGLLITPAPTVVPFTSEAVFDGERLDRVRMVVAVPAAASKTETPVIIIVVFSEKPFHLEPATPLAK